MRAILTSLVVLSLAACEGLPSPPNQTYGVFAFDPSTRTLWMNGDDPYYVPQSVNTGRLICARTITVTWEPQDDRRVVRYFSIDEWSHIRC